MNQTEPYEEEPPETKAKLRGAEQRKSRKRTLALAASVLLIAAVGAAAYLWLERERTARLQEKARVVEADLLRTLEQERDQATAAVEQGAKHQAMLERLRQVNTLTEEYIRPHDEALHRLRQDRDYREAFLEYGVDLDEMTTEGAAELLTGAITVDLGGALTHWAFIRRTLRLDGDSESWQRLMALARLVDPDPWRNELRDLVSQSEPDKDAFRQLALSGDYTAVPVASIVQLAGWLLGLEEWDTAIAVYRAGLLEHSGDFALNFRLGNALARTDPPRWQEAIKAYTVALAIEPEFNSVRIDIADALLRTGDYEGAESFSRMAIEIDSNSAFAYINLGAALRGEGLLDEAITAARKAIELEPNLAEAYVLLGGALYDKDLLDPAIAALQKAIELNPDSAATHSNLSGALRMQGLLDEAIAAARKAIELEPGLAAAHDNLSGALRKKGLLDEAIAAARKAIELEPDFAVAHGNLSDALYGKGLSDEAIAAARKAIELEPDLARAHAILGWALHGKGLTDQAIVALQKVIELKPRAAAHFNLGLVLVGKGLFDQAIAAFRKAIELDPNDAKTYVLLGDALYRKGFPDEAIAASRKAIELQPDFAEAHFLLGNVLVGSGKYREALPSLTRGHQLGSVRPDWTAPSAEIVRQIELLAAQEERLQAIVQGEVQSGDAAERGQAVELADRRNLFAASARLHGEAMDEVREQATSGGPRTQLSVIVFRNNDRSRPPRERATGAAEAWTNGQSAEAVATGFGGIVSRGLWEFSSDQEDNRAPFFREFALQHEEGEVSPAIEYQGNFWVLKVAGRKGDPNLFPRIAAIVAATRAGCGEGKDDLDEETRGRWRRQALEWLRQDVEDVKGRIDRLVYLSQIMEAPELAGVRDEEGLAELPSDEVETWRALWAEVKALRDSVP